MSSVRRTYPDDVKWAVDVLFHAGHTPAELSRRFGPDPRTICAWVALRGVSLRRASGLRDIERAELILLRFKERFLEDQLNNATELLLLAGQPTSTTDR